MRDRPAVPEVEPGLEAAIVALAVLSSDCQRLAIELRVSGRHPRCRLLCGSVLSQIARTEPLLEAIERNPRATISERRLVQAVKAARKGARPGTAGG